MTTYNHPELFVIIKLHYLNKDTNTIFCDKNIIPNHVNNTLDETKITCKRCLNKLLNGNNFRPNINRETKPNTNTPITSNTTINQDKDKYIWFFCPNCKRTTQSNDFIIDTQKDLLYTKCVKCQKLLYKNK